MKMSDVDVDSELTKQIKLIRKYLKLRIMEDNITFRDHTEERDHVYDLMKRTVSHGESHSALIIGPRGSGKTTLVNSVLDQLSHEVDLENDAIVVKLNGLIHSDEKTAIKSITAQMQLENAVGDRVFGTFAENLSFLLDCINAAGTKCMSMIFVLEQMDMFCKTGRQQATLYNLFDITHSGRARMCVLEPLLFDCINAAGTKCRSMIFVLEQMDMFCKTGRQQVTLYNLFDITHSGRARMCVLGITNRLDVMELLEKRVKSRFSHRHIQVFPKECSVKLFVNLLSLPVRRGKRRRRSLVHSQPTEESEITIPDAIYHRTNTRPTDFDGISPSFAEDWNAHINALAQDDKVIDAIEKFNYYTVNEQIFRNVLLCLVSKLSNNNPFIDTTQFTSFIDNTTAPEHAVTLLHSLSILELSLLCLVSKLSNNNPFIDTTQFTSVIDNTTAPEHAVTLLHSLSILELSLVIAMKHGMDVFDGQPMNFEMVLHRYTKFANTNSSAQTVPRPVILKAFEHLQALEIIMPVRNTDSIYNASETTASRVQKEYKLYTLAVPIEDINEAVKTFKALPTEISHWYNNSIV